MKVEKQALKSKVTSRKVVAQAIAKQDLEKKVSSQDLQEAIRLKAYELYLERGYANGDAIEDWLTAERIILQNSR